MLYQLFETTRDYILNNQKMEIRFRTEYVFPKIILTMFPVWSQRRAIKKYHDKYQKINKLIKLKGPWREQSHEYMFDILRNNFSEFEYITELDQFSMNSQLLIDNHLVEYPVQLEYFKSDLSRKIYLSYQFFECRLNLNGTKTTPSLLRTELSGLFNFPFIYIKIYSINILGNYEMNTLTAVPIEQGTFNNLIINSNFMKTHPNLGRMSYRDCNESKLGLFSDSLIDEMTFDCINRKYNQTYGCLPAFRTNLRIRFEKDLKHFKYTVCP